MANQLRMALIDSIFTLQQRGWSARRIAQELGIDRETVARYLKQRLAESKPAIAPLGSALDAADSKPAIALLGSEAVLADGLAGAPEQCRPDSAPASRIGRPSDCEPYRALIGGWLQQGLSAQRIYQDLVSEHGFTSKYPSVRRFVRQVHPVAPAAA